VNLSKFFVVLQAPYPYFKGPSSELIEETLTLVESQGFDYAFDYALDYQAGATTNQYILTNDGDAPARIKVVFNGSVINPTLTNTSAGNSVQIEKTLVASDVITLELTAGGRSITNQEGVSFEQFFNGETAFFDIPVGSNTLVFSASTFDASASCDITITKFYES